MELNEVVVHQTEKSSSKRDIKASSKHEGYNFCWNDVCYKVQVKESFFSSVKKEKIILQDSNGYAAPGSMMAIMGPSGSGKSSLLDSLAGRIILGKDTQLSGKILVNGKPRDSKFKRLAAYVMQDDTLQGALTVRENLRFSANLRLPSNYSHAEKMQKVEEIIDFLGLRKVADTPIGDPFRRGVSGGERRRVSIGMELIIDPRVLFLDEPTSGLDAHSALKICQLLKRLSRERNMCVIATIHQPSSQVYDCFDTLCLMSRGQQVYCGPLHKAVPYFSKLGFKIPKNTNPADYFAELINYDFDDTEASKKDTVQQLVTAFDKSKEKKELLHLISKAIENTHDTPVPAMSQYASNIFSQLYWLLDRTIRTYIKNPAIVHVRLFMYVGMALLVGTCYWKISKDVASIQDRMSALFFSVAFLTFMSIAAFPALIEDRLIFVRERLNGYYRVGAYVMAHSLLQLPTTFLMSFFFSIISYWMVGFDDRQDRFPYFFLTLWVALYVAESIVMVIAAVIPYYLFGIAVDAAFSGLVMVLNGYFVKRTNIPKGWIWMHYLSFQKYSFEGMVVNEFEGRSFECPSAGTASCQCNYPDYNNDCQ